MLKAHKSESLLRTMFDNCSQSTFILNKTARSLKLKGIPINYVLICTDGSKKKMKGQLYRLQLVDMSGKNHEIEAIGIDILSSKYPGLKIVNLTKKTNALPICSSITEEKLSRTGGELDLLIGTDLSALHPHAVANIDNLTLMKGMFGNGWTIMGHHSQHVQLLDNNEGVKVNFCFVERVTFSEQIENEISCS